MAAIVFSGLVPFSGQALGMAAIGIWLLLSPPEQSPGRQFDWAVLVLCGMLLVLFVPLGGGVLGQWRSQMGGLGASLPATMAIRPWNALEEVLSLLALVALCYALFQLKVSPGGLRRLTALLAVAFSCVAVISLVFGFTDELPQAPQSFGLHLDPHLTGILIAFGALLSLCLMIGELGKGFRLLGMVAVAMLVTCLAALWAAKFTVGIVAFLFGASLWYALVQRVFRFGKIVRYALPAALVVFLVMAFFHGLFEAEFPMHREAFVNARAILAEGPLFGASPGSLDETLEIVGRQPSLTSWAAWPRVVASWGVPITLALASMIAILIYLGLPPARRADAPFSVIYLAIVASAFIGAFFVDFGTWLVLAVLLLAYRFYRGPGPTVSTSLPPRWAFRTLGVILALAGGAWFVGRLTEFPTHSAIAERLAKKELMEAQESENYSAIDAAAEALLSIDPLAVDPYRARAKAALFLKRDIEVAERNYALARRARPHEVHPLVDEGRLWLPFDRDRALSAWSLALQRASAAESLIIFRQMMADAKGFPDLSQSLRELAENDSELHFHYLMGVSLEEMSNRLLAIQQEDPAWSQFEIEQRLQLGVRWAQLDDVNALILYLRERGHALPEQGFFLAHAYAASGDYRQAVAQLAELVSRPSTPSMPVMLDQEEKRRLLRSLGDNASREPLPIDLHRALEGGDNELARRLGQKILEITDQPLPYVRYWTGELSRQVNDYAGAWRAWQPLVYDQLVSGDNWGNFSAEVPDGDSGS